MKIRIAGADSSNAVFAHENSRMRVMQQITGEMRQLQNDLSGDVGMPVRGNRNGEARGSKEGSYELLRRARRARLKARTCSRPNNECSQKGDAEPHLPRCFCP
jgi:hypothetical protein